MPSTNVQQGKIMSKQNVNYAYQRATALYSNAYFALLGTHEQRAPIAKAIALGSVDLIIGRYDEPGAFEYLNEQLNDVYQAFTTPVGISHYTNSFREFYREVKSELYKF